MYFGEKLGEKTYITFLKSEKFDIIVLKTN